MPLSTGRIAVSGPTAGAMSAIAASSEYAFTAKRTRSYGPSRPSACTVRGRRSAFPCALSMRSPCRAICSARRGRTRKATSRPASTSLPPK